MNRQVVEDWFAAFQTRDVGRLVLAEDFVHASPYGEIRGRQVYLDLIAANPEAFFSRPITVIDLIEDGEKLAARYRVGTMAACDWFVVQEGQIVQIFSYYHVGEKPVF